MISEIYNLSSPREALREDFEELAEELDVVTGSISIEINKQTIVNMVFLVDD